VEKKIEIVRIELECRALTNGLILGKVQVGREFHSNIGIKQWNARYQSISLLIYILKTKTPKCKDTISPPMYDQSTCKMDDCMYFGGLEFDTGFSEHCNTL